jgi:hypothetical protein
VSLREKLRAKPPRTVVHPMVLGDTAEAEAALRVARVARIIAQSEEQKGAKKRSPKLAAALAAEEAAAAELGKLAEPVTVRAMPPADWEALVAAHPPQPKTDSQWDEATFMPAAVAGSVDSDMTEEDWAEFFASDRCSVGERDALWILVLALNLRAPELSQLPKDWTSTKS